jgi:hypothetical protein
MTGTEWQDVVFRQGRLHSKAAANETHLRLELEGLSRRSFTESWVPIYTQYPEMFAFCASVMPTTACVESGSSLLRGVKADYRRKMSSLSLGVLQASDLVFISNFVGVPFKFRA